MPELPEVQTIRTQLSHYLPFKIETEEYSPVHQSIVKVKEFDLKGKTIIDIERIGKMLKFVLDNDTYILSHFGMSGGWRYSEEKIVEKHTHIQFKGNTPEGELYFAYVDPRRFGTMYIVGKEKALEHEKGLGVDVSSKAFTEEYVYSLFKKFPQKHIKAFLLDQKYFAGVGNYMASEICAHARIRPTRRLKTLTKANAKGIIEGTKIVLDQSMETGGTTFAGGYADATGDKGNGVQHLVVFYQKICQLCKKTEVKKIVLATRGTYYCPQCQK